jgi:hypothetical protein
MAVHHFRRTLCLKLQGTTLHKTTNYIHIAVKASCPLINKKILFGFTLILKSYIGETLEHFEELTVLHNITGEITEPHCNYFLLW